MTPGEARVADDQTLPLNRDALVAHLESGCKPRAAYRIGAEHEKFVYRLSDHAPVPYIDDASGPGIKDVLEAFQPFGWQPQLSRGKIIGLEQNGASISLEPGGQLELSGAPLETIFDICDEVTDHLKQAKQIGQALKVGLLGMGFHPTRRRDEMPWMPKHRYEIMRAYMPTRGQWGQDMMVRTCTVQVNLDFSSEADMVKKFRTSLALQPVATALFANSPLYEGRPNGWKSNRARVWTDTDPDRTGMLPFVFEDGFGFERWVDYVLDVPMYFVQRDGRMLDMAGQSFRAFLDGRLDALPNETPSLDDWKDHLTTCFPEVRLKTYLEMRGADGGPWARLCALPALWVGLLYDDSALDAAWDLVKTWSAQEREALRLEAAQRGLDAQIRGRTMREVAREVLTIADAGLRARDRRNSMGDTEQGFLAALWETVDCGLTPADRILQHLATDWAGDADRAFDALAY